MKHSKATIVLTMYVIIGALGLLNLSACGRPGKPHAPGPAEKITYPRIYPPE